MSEHLTDSNELKHKLWIDDVSAENELAAKRKRGEVDDQESRTLTEFMHNGYAIVDIGDVGDSINALEREVGELWSNPPFDLAAAGPVYGGRPLPLSELAPLVKRGPGVRILDLHSHSSGARDLYLNAKIHRLVNLILGNQPVATQSLFFEYGSTQGLHRDPWYVNHTPRTHLVAAWFALEDIHPDAGPLRYVPGSHRMPWYRFSTGDVVFHDPRVTADERAAALEHLDQQIEKRGHKVQPALPRKGQVFLWHGSLVHGGSPVVNEALTRKSLVIHYGRSDTHPRRGVGMTVRGVTRFFYTEDKYQHVSGAEGFHSPFSGKRPADFADVESPSAPAPAAEPARAPSPAAAPAPAPAPVTAAAPAAAPSPWPTRTRWWQSPQICRHINRRICGVDVDGTEGGDIHVLKVVSEGKPFPRAVSIVRANAYHELKLLQAGVVENFVLHVPQRRAAETEALASSMGVRERVSLDFTDPLTRDIETEYDLVYWKDSLNGMPSAYAAVGWSKQVLAPGGFFYLNGFCGPTRLQYTDRQLHLAELARRSLSKKYLADPSDPARKIMPLRRERRSVGLLAAEDPTECPDSSGILPAVRGLFPDANITLTGGVVYSLALHDILANFDEQADSAVLEMMLLADDLCVEAGESLYCVAVGQRS